MRPTSSHSPRTAKAVFFSPNLRDPGIDGPPSTFKGGWTDGEIGGKSGKSGIGGGLASKGRPEKKFVLTEPDGESADKNLKQAKDFSHSFQDPGDQEYQEMKQKGEAGGAPPSSRAPRKRSKNRIVVPKAPMRQPFDAERSPSPMEGGIL